MSNRYFEFPNDINIPSDKELIFLGGDTSGIENWQARAAEVLHNNSNLIICNPRQNNKSILPSEKSQLEWRCDYINKANQIIFWVGENVVNTSFLLDLGYILKNNIPIFIGIHKNYPYKIDLTIKCYLYGYKQTILDDLDELLKVASNYNRLLKIVKTS